MKKVKDKKRLHKLQNKYCSEAYKFCEKVKALEDKLNDLAFNIKTPNNNLIIDLDIKNISFSQSQFFWQLTFVAINCFILVSKSQTSFNTSKTTVEVKKNKKYLNVPHFYNN